MTIASAADVTLAPPYRLYAEVAVNSTLPHRQTFSYGVPDRLELHVGDAVHVPFGRRVLQGVVVEIHDTPMFTEPEKIRPVVARIGERPLLDDVRMQLAGWIAREYLSPVYDAVALFLPPGFDQKPQTVLHALVEEDEVSALDLPPRLAEAMRFIAERRQVSAEAVRAALRAATPDGVIAALERRGLLVREYRLSRPRVTAKTEPIVRLARGAEEAVARARTIDPPKRSRRADVLRRLATAGRCGISTEEAIRLAGTRTNLERLVRVGAVRFDRDGHHVVLCGVPSDAIETAAALTATARVARAVAAVRVLAAAGEMPLAELRQRAPVGADDLARLVEAGIVVTREQPVARDPLAGMPVARRPPPVLLPAQRAAADAIVAAVASRRGETFLLHGVTGSGKTEVYLDALDRCIASGRRAIVLVPEIALTPQTVRRFRERIDRVAVLHSGLSDGERFDQWHGIADRRYDVVVGARSALFAPMPDLGLIILDEEHEWTYKQHDAHPRYHARDVAIELGRLTGAPVVLGSATPDVVSFERASRGAYRLLSLPERVRPVADADGVVHPRATPAMPRIDVVDLREELKAGNTSIFSVALTEALDATLRRGEQAILFLNRRGAAGHVQCRDCGYVPECPSCAFALTYHRQDDRLVCHGCNRRSPLPRVCRQCGSPRVRFLGVGVEKVEAEVARQFPHARLLRWDRDVTRGRGAHDRILDVFTRRDADILIGTQMLAKGLDLPAVTLVGVVNADVGLHLPDFRSGERTFQLLTQVAGRAGRGEQPGRVIIQTYTPEHYAIDAAARYDYEGFAQAELEARRQAGYPPYARLVALMHAHVNPRRAREQAAQLRRVLEQRRRELGIDVEVVGPSEPYVRRLRGRWRWRLLLRGRDPAALVRDFTLPPDWAVDVDPANLL